MGFVSLDQYPDFKKLQEHADVVIGELAHAPTWISYSEPTHASSLYCEFLEGQPKAWTVCPVYFGLYTVDRFGIHGSPEFNTRVHRLVDMLPTLFPATTRLLEKIPYVNYAAFTRLAPKTRLSSHTHQNVGNMIFHMSVDVPIGESGLRAQGNEHVWAGQGEVRIFDNNLEHGAWNDSHRDRIVFHMDFVQPEIFHRQQLAQTAFNTEDHEKVVG